MKNVFITGATGFLGSRLSQALHNLGWSVYSISRDVKNSAKALPFAYGHYELKYDYPAMFREIIPKADAVINLAGASLGAKRWTKEYKKIIFDSRIPLTRSISDAIIESERKPLVFISASAVGYYGDCGDEILTENSTPGAGFMAEICREWEKAALSADEFTRLVIPRMGVVLDRGEGMLGRLEPAFRSLFGGPLGSGAQWMSWIHIVDLINAFVWVLEHKEISGPVNFVAPQAATMNDLVKSLGEALGKPSFMKVPSFALRLGLGESADMILQGQRVVPRVLNESGFGFYYPGIREAFAGIFQEA